MKFKIEKARYSFVHFMRATEEKMRMSSVAEFINFLEDNAELEEIEPNGDKIYLLKETETLEKEFIITEEGKLFWWVSLNDKAELVDDRIDRRYNMNTYEITFKRVNGTIGSDRFTAATEAQARRDFQEVYRHGNGHITKVELISSDSPATKEQERKALEKIKKIVKGLGKNSYIGTAFEGCFEIAESNIENDFADSMKERYEQSKEDADYFNGIATHTSAELDKAREEIGRLRKQLEQEQEWKKYEIQENVPQSDYENLSKQSDTSFLTDEEAKDLLYDWFGFAKEKTTIYRSIPTYEKNRHNQLRKTGTTDRRPAYNATDWNYIRFDCGGMSYELYNDDLRFFCQ